MARQINRDPDENAAPPELACLAGAAGPWIKPDRKEFHHASKEAQEWFLRLSAEDVQEYELARAADVRRRLIRKWVGRLFVGATAGFGAVYAAGQRVWAIAHAISQVIADPSSLWQVLQGLFGQ